MIRPFILLFLLMAVLYTALIRYQVFTGHREQRESAAHSSSAEGDPPHKMYFFSFSKYTPTGEKEIEIEGDSANILTRTVSLMNVVAKAYAEETPVTITADRGNYDKAANRVYLKENVVATTENGTRLLTEELEIHPTRRMMETEQPAEIRKDNINVEGIGARGDSNLKKVHFKQDVTVMVQDPNQKTAAPTVVHCTGPLVIDYEKNIAHFKENVVAEDTRGKLYADAMDVFYNRVSRKISKIIATGNVVIENPDGNKTFSDHVIYLADEGKVILGGDAEAVYFDGEHMDQEMMF